MPDPAPIRGRWTVRTCPTCGAASVDPEDYVCTCTCALESVEVVPVPDEAAIERGAKVAWDRDEQHEANHPERSRRYQVVPWESAPAFDRAEYLAEAEAVLRAALEPETP